MSQNQEPPHYSTLFLLFFAGIYLAVVADLASNLLYEMLRDSIDSLDLAQELARQLQFGVVLALLSPVPPLGLKINDREKQIPTVVSWAAAVFFSAGTVLVLTGLCGWRVSYAEFFYGIFLILFAGALRLYLREREMPTPETVNWETAPLFAVGMILVCASVFGWHISHRHFLYGILLILPTLAAWIHFRERKTPIPQSINWATALSFAAGMILVVFGGVFGWDGKTIGACAIVAFIAISTLGVRKGWWSISLWIPESARKRLDGLSKQFDGALQKLSRLLRTVASHRVAKAAILLVACTIVIGGLVGLRCQILRAFDTFISLASTLRQVAKEHEDRIVFTTLGLASFAVLFAVLVTIIYERYSRRLTATVLAIAFLALATFFCVYTAPAIVTEAVIRPTATSALAPTLASTVTTTRTLTPTISATPTVSITASPTSMPTFTPTRTPWPTRTLTQTPVGPVPTQPSPIQTPTPAQTPAPELSPTPVQTPAPEEPPASEEPPAPVQTPAPEEPSAPVQTPAPEEPSAPVQTPAPAQTSLESLRQLQSVVMVGV